MKSKNINIEDNNKAETLSDIPLNKDSAEEIKAGTRSTPSVSEIVVTKDLDCSSSNLFR